ncbi:MAG TPA: hypothetical protein VKT70_09525 [Stellaceae bacterium]|nr:hypothetical protein [Stellaceae bacterium]
MRKKIFFAMSLSLFLVSGGWAFAQSKEHDALALDTRDFHVRGHITNIAGDTILVSPHSGAPISVKLLDQSYVFMVEKAASGDIRSGEFISTAATRGRDGRLLAKEVTIYPDFARNGPDGRFQWDLGQDSSLTIGRVGDVTSFGDTRVIGLTFSSGSDEVTIPTQAPIVTFGHGNREDLRVGASVFIPAFRQPSGLLATYSIFVGDHVPPPM